MEPINAIVDAQCIQYGGNVEALHDVTGSTIAQEIVREVPPEELWWAETGRIWTGVEWIRYTILGTSEGWTSVEDEFSDTYDSRDECLRALLQDRK